MDQRDHPMGHDFAWWSSPDFAHMCDRWAGRHGRHFGRRFQSKAEQIAELEAYLAELKAEVQAVEEHLADLRR